MQEKSVHRKSTDTVEPVKKRGRGRPKKDVTLEEEQKIRFLTADYGRVQAAARLMGKAPSVFIREAAVVAAQRVIDTDRNRRAK